MSAVLNLRTEQPKLRYSYKEVVSLLPDSYRDKVSANEASNRELGNRLLLWCITQSTHFLDHASANVLQFIIARTYGYAKEGELISINHFLSGVFAVKSGRSIAAPAVKDKATVYKALAVLEGAGLIERTRVTVNSADVVSLICVKAMAVLELEMTEETAKMLRISKKQKQLNAMEIDQESGEISVKTSVCRVGGFPTTRLSEKPTTEYINNKEDIKELSCSSPRNVIRISRSRKPKDEIDFKNTTANEAIEKAIARVTDKREAKVRRAARAGFIALSDFNATWQSVMIAAYGSCTVSGLTHKEYGMLKRIAKTHILNCSWREFLEWVVKNWRGINREGREFTDYKKRKHGDWSLKEEDRIFLGTDAPDTFMFVKNYGKLVKRFAQAQLVGSRVAVEESAEVVSLRKELEATKKQAAIGKVLLDKALSSRPTSSVAKAPTRKPVTIVNPETDTFFSDVDSDLPDWK